MQAKWARLILGGILLCVLAGLALAFAGGSRAVTNCDGPREAACAPLVLQLEDAWSSLEAIIFDYNLLTMALIVIFFAPGLLGSVALVMRRKALRRRPQGFFEV